MTITSDRSNSILPLVGRVLLAAIFLVGAFGKLAASGPTQGYIASVGLPMPVLAYVAAVIIELGGGLMLLVGYRTRAVALVLAIFSVVTALVPPCISRPEPDDPLPEELGDRRRSAAGIGIRPRSAEHRRAAGHECGSAVRLSCTAARRLPAQRAAARPTETTALSASVRPSS